MHTITSSWVFFQINKASKRISNTFYKIWPMVQSYMAVDIHSTWYFWISEEIIIVMWPRAEGCRKKTVLIILNRFLPRLIYKFVDLVPATVRNLSYRQNCCSSPGGGTTTLLFSKAK